MRVFCVLLLAPLWLACGGGDPTATADTAAAVDTPDRDTDGANVTLLGACEHPEGEAFEGRVLFSGSFGTCPPPRVPEALTVTDEAGWEALRADVMDCAGAPPQPLDLAHEYAVALGVAVTMTCGLQHPRLTLIDNTPGPWVQLALTDRSAGCTTACAMLGSWVAIVAVPRDAGAPPRLCRRIDHGCP